MISRKLPKLSVAHHGDTAWTEINQHTGRTDLPLDARGEQVPAGWGHLDKPEYQNFV